MAEEISFVSVIIVILLTLIYATTTYLGTDTFKKCDEINVDEEKINHVRYINHSLTAAITLASTLLLQKFTSDDGLMFSGILTIMGILASYFTYTIVNNESCKPLNKKDTRDYVTYGPPILFGTMCLIIIFLMMRKARG
tara:strand:+ start:2847 stop:3263 length:417 start_codon:yes stop_codon:yes gene_type:complete